MSILISPFVRLCMCGVLSAWFRYRLMQMRRPKVRSGQSTTHYTIQFGQFINWEEIWSETLSHRSNELRRMERSRRQKILFDFCALVSSSATHTFDLSPQYYSRIRFCLLKHGCEGYSSEGKDRESDGHHNMKKMEMKKMKSVRPFSWSCQSENYHTNDDIKIISELFFLSCSFFRCVRVHS